MKIEQLTETLYVTECILDHMVARDAYGFPLSVYEKNSTDCNWMYIPHCLKGLHHQGKWNIQTSKCSLHPIITTVGTILIPLSSGKQISNTGDVEYWTEWARVKVSSEKVFQFRHQTNNSNPTKRRNQMNFTRATPIDPTKSISATRKGTDQQIEWRELLLSPKLSTLSRDFINKKGQKAKDRITPKGGCTQTVPKKEQEEAKTTESLFY